MSDEKIQVFLEELTALSHKHGLGITSRGELFELEGEDRELKYHCDDSSKLWFDTEGSLQP